jgi:hypothetical protein
MVKKLSPIGDSLGLIIDRPSLDLPGIARATPLEIKTDGGCGATEDGRPRRDPSEVAAVRSLTVEDVRELHAPDSAGVAAGVEA